MNIIFNFAIGLIVLLLLVLIVAFVICQICKVIDYKKSPRNGINKEDVDMTYKRYYRQISIDFGIPLIFLTIVTILLYIMQFLL